MNANALLDSRPSMLLWNSETPRDENHPLEDLGFEMVLRSRHEAVIFAEDIPTPYPEYWIG